MDDSIKQKLSGLLELLRNPDIKSKQAAFNACFDDLTQVKEIISWEKIVEIIKQETGVTFDARTASNMYGRTRRKIEPNTATAVHKKYSSKPEHGKTSEKEEAKNNPAQKKVSNPGELKNLRSQKYDLDELKDGE